MSLPAMIIKVVIYPAVFLMAAWLWRMPTPFRWWRPVSAGIVRYAVGWVALLPLGYQLFGSDHGDWARIAVFMAARFLLWVAITKVFFRRVPMKDILALALASTLLNALLDQALFPEGLTAAFSFNVC
jgi:hypothetical protein